MATPEIDATASADLSSPSEGKPANEFIDSDPVDVNSDEKDVQTSEETNNEAENPGEADEPDRESAENNELEENGVASDNKEVTPAPQASETPAATPPETETSESDPISASPKETRPPKAFIYDPNKITLRFLFAGRDGIHVVIDFKPNDTVGEVKGALMSVWPEGKLIILCVFSAGCQRIFLALFINPFLDHHINNNSHARMQRRRQNTPHLHG